MLRSLGEKVAEGASAEIHAWAPDQVLKLFKPSVSPQLARYEARMTRAIFAAGGPAPEVLEEVTLEGRFGIVLPRLEGPTLLQLWQTDAMTSDQVGAVLASLFISIHRTAAPPNVVSLRDWMNTAFRNSADVLPETLISGVRTLLDRLPAGNALCHCDLHPGNVIMTADGPRIIDWTIAKRGAGPLDLGCSHFLLSELVPESFGDPERQRALNAAMQSEYARQADMSPAALTAAMAPYLPIIRVFVVIFAPLRRATRERLLQRVQQDLRSGEA